MVLKLLVFVNPIIKNVHKNLTFAHTLTNFSRTPSWELLPYIKLFKQHQPKLSGFDFNIFFADLSTSTRPVPRWTTWRAVSPGAASRTRDRSQTRTDSSPRTQTASWLADPSSPELFLSLMNRYLHDVNYFTNKFGSVHLTHI